MQYKRILTIQDISCLGQCSMTVALPILSACGQECCILPSAVLSTHTGGFGKPVVQDLSPAMEDIRRHWQSQGICFDLILVGYLGSLEAVAAASRILDTMLAPGGKTLVDPAMGDQGRLYSGLDEAYARAMGELCRRADVMLPNLTEAFMMAGLPYEQTPEEEQLQALLAALGGKNAVLTGVSLGAGETGAALRTEEGISYIQHKKIETHCHGTGDIFAAALTGAWAAGKTLSQAAQIAARFTCRCIELTAENPAHWYGVKFEAALPELIKMLEE